MEPQASQNTRRYLHPREEVEALENARILGRQLGYRRGGSQRFWEAVRVGLRMKPQSGVADRVRR
jgi:hypothetical protein